MDVWLWIVLAVVIAFAFVGLLAWRLERAQSEETRSLTGRISHLPWRAKARLAWRLLRDRRVPLWLRAAIPALVLYLALPLDLIPDFIPVLGHLDDLLVVALTAALVLRFTPRRVLEDHLTRLEATVPGSTAQG